MKKIDKKAPQTIKTYETAFNNFGKFCQEKYGKNMDEVIKEYKKVSNEQVLDSLQDYVNWNENSAGTIRIYLSRIKKYLHFHGIKFDRYDVAESIDLPKIHEDELHPISLDEFNKILENSSYKKRTLYLCMASSGMRPNEILNLRRKDIETGKERLVVHVPARFTKLKRARTTFFSIEAQKMLMPRLRELNENDLVFGSGSKSSVNTESINFLRLITRIGLDDRYESNNRHLLTLYSLRAFFITKLSRHDENLAKKFAGQKGYLLQYDRLTDEEKLQKYIEFEPDLIISQEEKLKLENKKQERELGRVADLEAQILELQDKHKQLKLSTQQKIIKLEWINQIKSYYLEHGKFPEVIDDGKTITKNFNTLNDQESKELEDLLNNKQEKEFLL